MTTPSTSAIWFEVIDPNTSQHYYANPSTGECLWDSKPATSSINPTDPNGDWWELWDEHNQLPYYYQTRTKETRWTKPDTEKTVISLIKVQQLSSTASKRLSVVEPPQVETATWALDRLTEAPPRPAPQRSTSDIGGISSKVDDSKESSPRPPIMISMTKSISTSTINLPVAAAPANRQPNIRKHFSRSKASIETAFANLTRGHRGDKKSQVSAPINNNPEARMAMHPLTGVPTPDIVSQIDNKSVVHGDNSSSSRMMMLPSSLQQDINQFAIDGFAQKYFATHKRGLFRRRVPMKEMLEWTKESLNRPLITLNKDLYKDAQKCFKMIQTIMGDRPRSRLSSDVEDIQGILNCGISKGQMRDEIYVQLCKQLHHNPRGESVRKGWEILCTVCITFPPSKNLESYLTSFVQQHHQVNENDVDVMSQHVSAKLERICIRGAKGKVLTAAEIERAKIAPFKPSVFGEPLSFIMSVETNNNNKEEGNHRSLQIPRIVPFLADAVIRMNGQRSEGIFRVPGDADAITDLRVRIENGDYDASGITDPNEPASLLKYWIRDLPEPLICAEYYDSCVACNDDAEKAIAIINSLPDINRRIVLYMLAFLQEFIDPDVIKHTLMNVSNLAMVFAPNLLRCPSEALTTVLKNSKFEQGFLRTLLLELEVDKDACAYDSRSERVMGKRKRPQGTRSLS